MAIPAGTTKTYDLAGLAEDFEDVIYDISPLDTYFINTIGRSKASARLHNWQIDTLAAAVDTNSALEGDDFSAVTATSTTTLGNYLNISKKEVAVSGTVEAVDKYGREREMVYQMLKRGKELKRDIEKQALSNKAATVGAAAGSRVSAGAETWIYLSQAIVAATNTTKSFPAPPNGIPTSAHTDGTAAAFATALLTSALQQAWENGGETDTILTPPGQKATLNTIAGIATRFRDVAAGKQAHIVAAADVFVSDFGQHKIVLSRYMRTSTILCLDTSLWSVAYLRPIQTKEIATTGDNEKRMVLAEWTLVCRNPLGNTKIAALT